MNPDLNSVIFRRFQPKSLADRLLVILKGVDMRAELTPTQVAEHLAKRKELWEARQTATTCRSFECRGNKRFASETAEKTGVDSRTVQRAIARATAIPEDVRYDIRAAFLASAAAHEVVGG